MRGNNVVGVVVLRSDGAESSVVNNSPSSFSNSKNVASSAVVLNSAVNNEVNQNQQNRNSGGRRIPVALIREQQEMERMREENSRSNNANENAAGTSEKSRRNFRENRTYFDSGMSDEEVWARVKEGKIGDNVEVRWSWNGSGSYLTQGVVCGVDSVEKRVTVNYLFSEHLLKSGIVQANTRYPLPPIATEMAVFSVRVLRARRFGLPAIQASTREITASPDYVVSADGGTITTNGHSSAAIVVRRKNGDAASGLEFWDESHDAPNKRETLTWNKNQEVKARFYPSSTNNTMELIALLAALRYAEKNPSRDVVILLDSQQAYELARGNFTARQPHLKVLVKKILEVYARVVHYVILARMLRDDGNPADAACKKIRADAQAFQHDDLFDDLPAESATTKTARTTRLAREREDAQLSDDTPTLTMARSVQTLQDFTSLYSYRARSTVPASCMIQWANIVKQHTQMIVAGTGRDDFSIDDAMLAFVLLPILYLPSNAPPTRLEERLSDARPFHLKVSSGNNNNNNNQDGAAAVAGTEEATDAMPNLTELAEAKKTERLSKAVDRLAADHKLRSAVKLMYAASTADDLSPEEKVRKLRAKIIDPVKPLEREQNLPPTPTFSGKTVKRVLYQMPKQAATCVDRWTPQLMVAAIQVIPDIADDVARICGMINDSIFSKRVMDILRLGRLVGIPKEDDPTGVRPITISSFFVKLTGSLLFHQAKPRCSMHQFAIGRKNGCEAIVHKVRRAYQEGKAIIRIDVSNAFGTACRSNIGQLLKELNNGNNSNVHIRKFFDTMYANDAKLAVFASGGKDATLLDFNEGVRQGDAFSGFFFCLLIDKVIEEVLLKHPCDVTILAYMDDMTIITSPELAREVTKSVIAALKKWHFRPNVDKSKVLCLTATSLSSNADQEDAAAPATPTVGAAPSSAPIVQQQQRQLQQEEVDFRSIKSCDDSESFVTLGANITNSYATFNEKQRAKTYKFFHRLQSLKVHPQVMFTIARLCGSPRMIYYASTNPPQHTAEVLADFQNKLTSFVEEVLDFTIPAELVHERFAVGLPDYKNSAADLYDASLTLASGLVPKTVEGLVHNMRSTEDARLTAHLQAQASAEWLYYAAPGTNGHLTPDEFRIAMAIRCHTLTRRLQDLRTSNACHGCGVEYADARNLIDHAFNCKHTHHNPSRRHTDVKEAIIDVCREFGLAARKEPTMYKYPDANRRPDITISTGLMTAVVTDVVICQQLGQVGDHAACEAQTKNDIHEAAVQAFGHNFIPFAMEVHGHRDASCNKFANAIKQHLRHYLQRDFLLRFRHTVSAALARARARQLVAALPLAALC